MRRPGGIIPALLGATLGLLPQTELGRAADGPSVLVRTVPARPGTLPALVTAYGSVIPSRDVATTLSLRQEGFVASIAVTPGEAVHAGQALLEFDTSAGASAAFRQALGALALARDQRAHVARLLEQRLATQDQLAQADATLRDARAAVDTLRVDGAGHDRQSVRAPADGIVGAIPVAEGDRVAAGAPLLNFTRLDDLVATVGIEPADQSRVRPGQAVTLEPVASGASPPGPVVHGAVLRVDGALNPRTRLIDVDVGSRAGSLLAGAFYKAAIETGQAAGWIVPHESVLEDDSGTYLFQAVSGAAVRVAVSVAGGDGARDLVEGKLVPGLPVVVAGASQLEDKAAIRTADPAP